MLQCKKPLCVKAARSASISPRSFIRSLKGFPGAALKEQNMLPPSAGRYVRRDAVRGLRPRHQGDPDRIGALERFVATRATERYRPRLPADRSVWRSWSGGRLTAAAELAAVMPSRYSSHSTGWWRLTYGIPAFRLPDDVVRAGIDQVLDLGVRLKKNTSWGGASRR